MEISIPAIPLGITALLAFFSPYAIAALNGILPFVTKAWQKKVVSIVFAVLLGGVVIGLYVASGGVFEGGNWVSILLASVVVIAASYALVTRPSANRVEQTVEESRV